MSEYEIEQLQKELEDTQYNLRVMRDQLEGAMDTMAEVVAILERGIDNIEI